MIKYANREQTSQWAVFMVELAPYDIIDSDGCKVSKLSLFNHLYEDHVLLNSRVKFDVKKDVAYRMIVDDQHPGYKLVKSRRDVHYNEQRVEEEKIKEVLMKTAAPAARKIRGRINDKEKLVTTYESLLNVCMEVAYSVFNNHDKIGKEIESSYL